MIDLKWSVLGWEDIAATIVSNCFSHSGLFVSSHLPSVADLKEHMVERELQDAFNILTFRNLLAITNTINQ